MVTLFSEVRKYETLPVRLSLFRCRSWRAVRASKISRSSIVQTPSSMSSIFSKNIKNSLNFLKTNIILCITNNFAVNVSYGELLLFSLQFDGFVPDLSVY